VAVHEGPEGKYFPPSEMKILNLAKEFFRYGVEPRHLRMYTQFVGREASFIEQIIRPHLQHKDPNTKRAAIKDLENLMSLSQMFTGALLREALSRYLPRPAGLDILEEESGEDADMDTVSEGGEAPAGAPAEGGEGGAVSAERRAGPDSGQEAPGSPETGQQMFLE